MTKAKSGQSKIETNQIDINLLSTIKDSTRFKKNAIGSEISMSPVPRLSPQLDIYKKYYQDNQNEDSKQELTKSNQINLI